MHQTEQPSACVIPVHHPTLREFIFFFSCGFLVSIPFTLFFASLTGSVIGLGFMIGKGVGRRFALPFAPFLCLGALVYLFFGSELMEFYFPSGWGFP